jgi:hypothetical protein
MNKTLLIAMVFSLVIIPSVLSVEITNESREYMKYWISVSNFTTNTMTFQNFDGREFIVRLQVIPYKIVYGLDYNISNWNPVLNIYSNRGEFVQVDTTDCWAWWDEDPTTWEEYIAQNCPFTSFEVKTDDDYLELTFEAKDINGTSYIPSIPFRMYYWGYSTAYADSYITYSDTKNTARDALAQLFTLNINAWKGAYYLLIVVVLVIAGLFVIGFIPLFLKKLFEKSVK